MAVKKRRGRARRKAKTQARSLANQVAAAYGQAAEATRSGPIKLDQWSRNAIRTQPYASALVLFGAGWFVGKIGGFLGGKTRGAAGLLSGETYGIGRLLGHDTRPWASIALRILATALVDVGAPSQ